MPNDDRSAGYALIETGTLANFTVISTHVEPAPDGESSFVRVELKLGGSSTDEEDDEDEEDGDDVEWAAFGFLFVLAVLRFAMPGPRERTSSRTTG